MINSEMETVCTKRMKNIIDVYGKESNLIQVSNENVEKTLLEIADVRIRPTVTISSLLVKHALYNLENFRPEIRSAFELQLFNVWSNAYKSLDVDQANEMETEILPPAAEEISEAEKIVEEPSVMQEVESEVEEPVEKPVSVQIKESVEEESEENSLETDAYQIGKKEPERYEQSLGQADETEAFLKKRKCDWFDFLLDFSAAWMQFCMRLLFKKNDPK